ncbi:isochorismatase family protein [Grosmannia clavigera kw1407]|uniref:nicotinamidase n=1 Tax=Grosmannia clavigera (strain kw1407 / UAMH 11150) TaxID=655863 RepID=F0XCW7_GROCL|nr:isochorismatase family protein [Grosmannia clavigera kw1407]EFX03713.1 isochorismatase family protein [Grosmannia clavigera kw1407]
MTTSEGFNPAIVIVDLQEDFCPPNGSLAVANGRDTVKAINSLLALPFSLCVATKDWHPQDHISFASNHPGKRPYVDYATVTNPLNPAETPYETRLWPDHCVQGSPGAELIPELDHTHIHKIIEKGTNKDVEMYSAFYDPFEHPRVCDSGLAALLRSPSEKSTAITHVYVVGLAADYCVRCTALDARKEGFVTYIVQEATRPVDPAGWLTEQQQIQAAGVGIISIDGPEVARVKALK